MDISAQFLNENNDGKLTVDGVDYFTVIPPEISSLRQVFDQWVADGGVVTPYQAPAPGSYVLSKLQIINAMSDEQLDYFDAAIAGQTTRFRRSWLDCSEVSSDHPFFQVLRNAMVDVWGETEAERILGRPA
jgi:hypothetical protein